MLNYFLFRDTNAGQPQPKDKGKAPSEADRRQSLFPGKKEEKWIEPLQDKRVQQVVSFFHIPLP